MAEGYALMPEKSIIVSGDWHIGGGFDRHAFRKFLQFVSTTKHDEIILNGDIIDAATCGKYVTKPGTPVLKTELRTARKVLAELRAATKAPITYIGGNHCYRTTRLLLEKVPGLYGTVDLAKLMGLDDLGIAYRPNKGVDNFIKRGNLLIGHFLTLRQDAGASAIASMKKYGTGIVTGHGHRLAVVGMRLHGRTLWGAESGCMTSLNPEYMSMANWQNGFIVIEDGFPRAVRV
jgi:hypothetical protein